MPGATIGPTRAANGATQLAGLQATAPFGFAGQYYDAGPGTYDMRAREYNPATGQFASEDPQAPTDTLPVTLDPYEYAGDMPTDVIDPSGQGWIEELPGSSDELYELQIQADISRDHGASEHAGYTTEYNVPLYTTTCAQPRDIYKVGILSLAPDHHRGYFWDIEHVQAYTGHPGAAAIASGITTHLALPLFKGAQIEWGNCPYARVYDNSGGATCPDVQVTQVSGLKPGGNYLQYFGLGGTGSPTDQSYTMPVKGQMFPVHVLPDWRPTSQIVTWAEQQQEGLILYDRFPRVVDCGVDLVTQLVCAWLASKGLEGTGVQHPDDNAAPRDEAQVTADEVQEVLGLTDATGEDTLQEDLTQTRNASDKVSGCSTCFAAGTLVALPRGKQADRDAPRGRDGAGRGPHVRQGAGRAGAGGDRRWRQAAD